ncbi:GNAT family N-acetyltransferase [Hymenobacter lucidus]|uniref:GNAT family N-acetyltransferase n=1 Tax=Hymenobacter lucidus TaxID=2880930 RepID=A0ABS8AWX3_9BACT|nr:GNAT family N-acetyltransferase [Hymenobacter lucidus]MCB2410306.1 GNAT family N-acetyltransferase [Hymenobacter lucidus]
MSFTLRPWQPTDLPNLVQYANNPEIARFMTDQFPHPFTEEKAQGFIAFAGSHTPQRVFAIEVDGQAAGGIGIHPQTDIQCKNAELGYWLAQPFWGRGIVTEAIRQVVAYGFATFDITRIFARPYGTNIGSQRALEKAGFVLEGRFAQTLFKNGEFLDELVYAVRRHA